MNDFVGYIDSEGNVFDGSFDYEGGVGPIGPRGPQGEKGDKGDKGDKPTKGVDYFTQEDIDSMVGTVETYVDTNYSAEFTKLEGIEAGAEVNIIEDIKVNGTSQTPVNKAVSITIPVNNVDFEPKANTATTFDLTIDSGTFVVTLALKNSAGNTLKTESIDLPLESVVVNGEYDNVNKKLILTLENGNTVEIPIGDLISGLVPDSRTIAGIDLQDNITKAELLNALELGDTIIALTEDSQIPSLETGLYYVGDYKAYFNSSSYVQKGYLAVQSTSALTLFTHIASNFGTITSGRIDKSVTPYDLIITQTENSNFKVQSISPSSLTTQYPSAKCLYDELVIRDNKIHELLDQIPTATATGETIHVEDSSNLPPKDFTMLGNATQETTSISGGDEYDSPSPDHPQPIHVVTGDNTLVFIGKNLADFENITYNVLNNAEISRTGDKFTVYTPQSQFGAMVFYNTYLKLKPSTTYTFSARVVSTTSSTGSCIGVGQGLNNTGSAKFGNLATAGQISSYTFTTPDEIGATSSYIALYTYEQTKTAVFTDLQIEENSSATGFQKYTEQTQLLSLGDIKLANIGDYTDKIYKDNGKWYEYHKTKKRILDGTENWGNKGNSGGLYCYSYALSDYLHAGVAGDSYGLCDHSAFKVANGWNDALNRGIGIYVYPIAGTNVLYVVSTVTTTADFKTWLSNNNIKILYPLQTPTYTEITDTTLIGQLENVLKMHTNKNVTNGWIEPSGTNAQGGMVLVYRKDLETVIDNLNNAILSINT